MKLSRTQIELALEAVRAQSSAAGTRRPQLYLVTGQQTETTLSRATARMRNLCQLIKEMPDTRPERLTEVVSALDRGVYSPSADEVAEQMLGRLIADRLR